MIRNHFLHESPTCLEAKATARIGMALCGIRKQLMRVRHMIGRVRHMIGVVALLLSGTCFSNGDCLSPISTHRPGFGKERVYATHREVDVWWRSEGSMLAGTLYLPIEHGPHPAIVFHFGSTKWTRIRFDGTGIPLWIARGIAVLSYDKRGVGQSQGTCCPWQDPNYFPLLGKDLLAAVRMIRSHPDIDSARIGLFGFSQGGWVVPTAAAAAPSEIAFTIIGSGPAVPLGEEVLFSRLTGDDKCKPSGLREEEIEHRLSEASPSGFDPTPYLEGMQSPALWVYGNRDTSIPVKRSVANLHRIAHELNKDFTVIVLPVNHEWIVNGAMCQSKGRTIDANILFDWLMPRLRSEHVAQPVNSPSSIYPPPEGEKRLGERLFLLVKSCRRILS